MGLRQDPHLSHQRGDGVALTKDAHAVDADMRTSSDFLMRMRKGATETEFACYIRNHTARAIALQVPLGRAEREARMSDAAYAQLKDRIRRQVAAPIAETDAHIAGVTPTAPAPCQEATSFADEY